MEENKISLFQFSILLVTFIMGTTLIICPEIIIAKESGWIADLLAIGFSFISLLILYIFHKIYPGLNIIQIGDKVGGKIFSFIISIAFFIYVLQLGSLNLRIITDFLSTAIMTEMPGLIFSAGLIIVTAYALIQGIEAIGRICQLIFPVVTVIFILLLILAVPEYQFTNLFPIEGKDNIFYGGFFVWMLPLGNIILFSFLIPFTEIKENVKVKRAFGFYLTGALIFSGILVLLKTMALIMVMGAELASIFAYPVFSMVGVIEIGEFLERLEPAFLIMWIGAAFINILICYWVAVECLRLFNTYNDNKLFILPTGIIIISLERMLFLNFSEQYNFLLSVWPIYSGLSSKVCKLINVNI